jgi:CheY-like chemotaxis protein
VTWRRALEREGIEVDAAGGGDEAIAAAARNPPDLVLLDLEMPGMSGLEVLTRLRREGAVPVIVLSGHAGEILGARWQLFAFGTAANHGSAPDLPAIDLIVVP